MATRFRALGPHPVELQIGDFTHSSRDRAPGTAWLPWVVGCAVLVPFGVALFVVLWNLGLWWFDVPLIRLVPVDSWEAWLHDASRTLPGALLLNAPELIVLPPLFLLAVLGPPLVNRLSRRTVRVDDIGLHAGSRTLRWDDLEAVVSDNVEWSMETEDGRSVAIHPAVITVNRDGTRLAWVVKTFVEADALAAALENERASRTAQRGSARDPGRSVTRASAPPTPLHRDAP
jgi:hypothetical protein